MSFKPRARSLVCWVVLFVTTGCGILGQKAARTRLLQYIPGNAGCMNDAGSRMSRYFAGELSAEELKLTLSCATSSLTSFKQYVRGSGPDGAYTPNDVQELVGEVLVTDKPVSLTLMKAAFELKASILGGNAEVMTVAEIDQILGKLDVTLQLSLEMLPHLKTRKDAPTTESMLAFIQAGEQAALRLATTIAGPSLSALPAAAVRTLATELLPLLDLEGDPRWAEVALAAKQAIAGGASDSIESIAWQTLISQIGRLAAAWMAVAAVGADGPVMSEAANRTEHALLASIRLHPSGGIPLTVIDRIFDNLPPGKTTLTGPTLKTLARAFVDRLFPSGFANAIDGQTAHGLVTMISDLGQGWMHIDRLWDRAGLDPRGETTARVATAIADYRASVDPEAIPHLDRLQKINAKYRPLFADGETHVTFDYSPLRTRTDLRTFHWMHMAAGLILNGYGSVKTSSGSFAVVKDFENLINDIRGLVRELQLMNPDIPLLHERRFREGDLFTFSSNGDDQVDLDELTYLFGILSSIGSRARVLKTDISSTCSAGIGTDPIGWEWLTAPCLRREYFAAYDRYWVGIPELVGHYDSLSSSKKAEMERNLEAGARINGYSDNPFDGYDTQAMLGGPHYVEALYMRYDTNFDGELDVPELLKAVPTFKLMIAKQGNLSPNDTSMIEAIFTYIVKHGHPPKDGILGIIDLLSWKLRRPWWEIHARRNDVFKIISFFNSYGEK